MTIRRTLYGAAEQVSELLGCPIPTDFLKASTINTTLNIQPNAIPTTAERVRMRGFMIGIGAHAYTTGIDQIALPSSKDHLTTDAGLFKPVAACIREKSRPLTETERALYCLRRMETVNGVESEVYYGIRFDPSATVISSRRQRIEDGRIVEDNEFMPTSQNREPTPVSIPSQSPNPLAGEVGRILAPIRIDVTSFLVGEILNASRAKYGTDEYAFISEIGLLTFADRQIQSPNGSGSTVPFKEAIGATIYCHIPTMLQMRDYTTGVPLVYNLGAMEPLFVRGG